MVEPHKPPYRHYRQHPWRSRGYLPHFDQPARIQSVSFRLADSLPQAVLLARLETIPERQQADRRAAIDELLDQGYGACWLRRPDLAQLVENALLHFDGERWRTLAWNVMPNHVHWLVEPLAGLSLAKLLQTVKGFTGREANRILGQTGAFWEREYHDRVIRDDQHLLNVIAYIHNNPVKSGLVKRAEDWRWSSAWGDRLGELPL